MNSALTIKVQPEFPPIPDRSCDWAAWVDGREEATTCHGPTPAAALRQLADQIEAEEPPEAAYKFSSESIDERRQLR